MASEGGAVSDALGPLAEMRKLVQVQLAAKREAEALGMRDPFQPIRDFEELAEAIDYALRLDAAVAEAEAERDGARADADAARKECTALTLHVWNLDTKMSAHLAAAEARVRELERTVETRTQEVDDLKGALISWRDGKKEARIAALEGALRHLAEYVKRDTAGLSATDWTSLEERALVEGMLKDASALLAAGGEKP